MNNEIKEIIETQVCTYPICDYRFIESSQIEFDEKIRLICQMDDCEMYDRAWTCPPVIGTVEECVKRLHEFKECFVFTTVCDVSYSEGFDAYLRERINHEEITYEITKCLSNYSDNVKTLSTGCPFCEKCTYPSAPCRHPEKAFATIESHGIIVMKLAEQLDIALEMGSDYVTYISLIFFNLKSEKS
jgi:predicted metal-binding protein